MSGCCCRCRGQGLGNSAIASVASEEQLARFGGKWAAMAITEPEAGSDSAAIRTTAVLDGDEWVLNGEKIFVTSGERAELIVVWATVDRSKGRAAIKSFVVPKDTPGLVLERLEHKLGIRASDTANFRLEDCRIPRENLLGSEEVKTRGRLRRGDADVRQHEAAGRGDGCRPGARLPGGDLEPPERSRHRARSGEPLLTASRRRLRG